MAGIKEYLELIIALITFLSSLIVFIVYIVKQRKAIKNAKTQEEKEAIINEVKAKALGFINVADNLFTDIPKSGPSKLLYVLNEIKKVCSVIGIEFDEEYWKKYTNERVDEMNAVLDEKANESEKANVIENVKREIPFLVEEANKLFVNIPDSVNYEIEYVLKKISIACEKYSVNVYSDYDWRAYVESYYKEGE